MLTAKQGKEIVVVVHNEIGILADLSRLIAQKGINILAACAWTEGENGIVHLVTDDNLRAIDALKEKSYHPRERDVVLAQMTHKPGMLRHITEALASKGIDIHHLYASAETDQLGCLVVLATANNDSALVQLNE